MKRWRCTQRVTWVLLLLVVLSMIPQPSGADEQAYRATVSVYFSPDGGCSEAIVQALQAARQRVLVQAYTFTSAPIAKALVEAHTRGVAVQVLLDKSNVTAHYSSVTFLRHAGIPVAIDSQHAIAHNKIIIIDDTTILTGSFNFTKAAEHTNAENLVVLKGNRELVQRYRQNWLAHAAHSQLAQETPAASSRSHSRGTEHDRQSEMPIHGNRRSHVYHLPTCPDYEKLSPKNIEPFTSEEAAQRAGYRKAGNCP